MLIVGTTVPVPIHICLSVVTSLSLFKNRGTRVYYQGYLLSGDSSAVTSVDVK